MTALVFASFHSKKHGGVALLTAAYAMAALIPNKGLFREEAVKVTSSDGSFLFVTMVGTFLGGGLEQIGQKNTWGMMMVDGHC